MIESGPVIPWHHLKMEVLMPKRKMKIGIMSREDYQKRTITIAKGEYKATRNEPRVWFESLESMALVLSGKNRELLRLIQDHRRATLSDRKD